MRNGWARHGGHGVCGSKKRRDAKKGARHVFFAAKSIVREAKAHGYLGIHLHFFWDFLLCH